MFWLAFRKLKQKHGSYNIFNSQQLNYQNSISCVQTYACWHQGNESYFQINMHRVGLSCQILYIFSYIILLYPPCSISKWRRKIPASVLLLSSNEFAKGRHNPPIWRLKGKLSRCVGECILCTVYAQCLLENWMCQAGGRDCKKISLPTEEKLIGALVS